MVEKIDIGIQVPSIVVMDNTLEDTTDLTKPIEGLEETFIAELQADEPCDVWISYLFIFYVLF